MPHARFMVSGSVCILLASIFVSFFFLAGHKSSITSVLAVETGGIGVFWDENQTEIVSSIDWGTLLPGSVKDVTVYVWNGMKEPVFLSLRTMDWVPVNASEFISVEVYHNMRSIAPDEVMKVTLTIRISPYVTEITNFGVNMLLSGLSRPPSDINQDRKVDIRDIATVAKAFGSSPDHPNWNPSADINENGKIDIRDIAIVARDFGLNY